MSRPPAGLTRELPSSDWRWPLWAGSVLVLVLAFLLTFPSSPIRGIAPRLVEWSWPPRRSAGWSVQEFMVVSFALWAVVFGVQRYAVPLELLLVPTAVATAALVIARPSALLVLTAVLAIGLGMTTQTVNWGRIPMPSGPAIPLGSTWTLQRYDSIILAATPPIGDIIPATGGNDAAGTRPGWFVAPYSPADAARAAHRMSNDRVGVAMRADAGDRDAQAAAAASTYGFRVTHRCQSVTASFGDPFIVCDLVRADK